MVAAEHISLESDERVVPTLEIARKVHARIVLRGGFGQNSTELALIDYLFLSVRTARAQKPGSRYVIDLRFVDPRPRLERRVAWRWVAAGSVLLALAFAGARDVAASPASWWLHEWLPATAVLFGLAGCAFATAVHLTSETLILLSAHGRARLLSHVGRLGTFRELRAFLPRLDAHLRVACAARRRSRAAHLRDEMREHFRLRGAGALTESEYEAAKPQILATHTPVVAGAPRKKARVSPPGPCRPLVRA